jgi:hypothetical protein
MRWLCQDCGTVTADADLLRAPSPFDPETELSGCPECKSHDAFVAACEVCGKRACGGLWRIRARAEPPDPQQSQGFAGFRRLRRA